MNLRRARYSSAAVALVLSAACVDSPMAPTPASGILGAAVDAALSKPALDNTLQGQAWVCEDGAEPAGSFTFAVSVDGGPATNHSVARGTCVMVHSVSTVGSTRASVSVTESVPADWTLQSISIESNLQNRPDLYEPVINPPNASATIRNDVGVVFTFNNDRPPSVGCTRTQGYWKNHEEDWDQVSDGTPFLITTIFYNSGTSYLNIMRTPPKGGNAYLQLAHQFIAARLNLNGGSSGIASVDAALSGAHSYFSGAPAGIPNPGNPTRAQLQSWATTLDDFNNGLLGPGHCD